MAAYEIISTAVENTLTAVRPAYVLGAAVVLTVTEALTGLVETIADVDVQNDLLASSDE